MAPLARDVGALDVSLGGIRVYSDHELKVGSVLHVELSSDGCPRVVCTTEVVRVHRLGRDAKAPYEVGLRFLDFDAIAVKVLLHLLTRGQSLEP